MNLFRPTWTNPMQKREIIYILSRFGFPPQKSNFLLNIVERCRPLAVSVIHASIMSKSMTNMRMTTRCEFLIEICPMTGILCFCVTTFCFYSMQSIFAFCRRIRICAPSTFWLQSVRHLIWYPYVPSRRICLPFNFVFFFCVFLAFAIGFSVVRRLRLR